MIRLFILLTFIACIKVEQPEAKSTSLAIALVKYKDVIYHCESIVKTSCGHTLNCGNLSFHCANNLVVEYLN